MGLFKRSKNKNNPLIRQILDLVPRWMFTRCAEEHKSDKSCSRNKIYENFRMGVTKYDINLRNYFNLKPNSSHEITGKIIGCTFDPKQPPRNIATKDYVFERYLTLNDIIYTYQNEKLCYSQNKDDTKVYIMILLQNLAAMK